MADPVWDADNLCAISDVEEVIGDSVIANPTSKGDRNTVIRNAIVSAGKELVDMLLDFLPDIYAQSAIAYSCNISYDVFLLNNNYSQENLETMLEKVKNPECMKLSAAAQAAIILTRQKKSDNEFSTPERIVMMNELMKDYNKLFDDRFERGWRKLKIDLNQDGAVSNAERPRSQNSYRRI